MIAAQLGREAVAELLLKKGQIPTAGKGKQTIFGWDREKYSRNWFRVSKAEGERVFSFYFVRLVISFVRGWFVRCWHCRWH